MRTTSGSRYLIPWFGYFWLSSFTKLQPGYFFWFHCNFHFLDIILVSFHLTDVNYQWIISSMLKGIICLTLSFPMNGKPHLYYFYVEFNDAGPGCSRGSEGAWMAQGELHSRVYQAMSLWCCWVKALWTWERWLVWRWAILWVTLVLANQPMQWRILAHSSPVQWLRICFYIA